MTEDFFCRRPGSRKPLRGTTTLRDDWLGEEDGEPLCPICGAWLSAEELDRDLCETFLGAIICFYCAARWRRWMAE